MTQASNTLWTNGKDAYDMLNERNNGKGKKYRDAFRLPEHNLRMVQVFQDRPEMAIDEKGIQPNDYLDSSIPDKEWVEHIRKILEE